VLVPPGTGLDDTLACATPLPKREAVVSQSGGVEAVVSQSGGVGREEHRGYPGFVSQSQVGKAVYPFLRIVWCGKDDG